jgi:HD superfamily phosphohydrolase
MHGPIEIGPEEIKIIDSPYVQRLRGIKQTGFAELAFPGATHNRYSHSLGACHLAGRVFDRVFDGFDWKNDEERSRARHILRMAALLHDVGHGPLSHAIEQAMPSRKLITGGEGQATHEDYTQAIILRSSLTQLLQETFGTEMPEIITHLIQAENPKPEYFRFGKRELNLFPILSSLISGELDVDRMDYLPRDSHYCGISYGNYDRDWIFSNLLRQEIGTDAYLALDSRAIYAVEDFLLSRYHMYLQVYLHHKSVVYDEMLFQFLKREGENVRLPHQIEDYLEVDDHWLMSHLRKSKSSWARRILEHRPYKMLIELHSDEAADAKKYADDLEDKLKREGTSYFRSSSTGLLSKYTAHEKTPGFPIFVVYRDPRFTSVIKPGAEFEALSDATALFQRFKRSRIIDRIYADV